MNIGLTVLIIIVLLALILVKKSLIIIPQSETKIVERLGKYYATLQPGINIIIPFIDRAKELRWKSTPCSISRSWIPSRRLMKSPTFRTLSRN